MQKHRATSIDQYLAERNDHSRELVLEVRGILHESFPEADEWINSWGNPVYSLNDQPVAWISSYDKHINLGFFRGSELDSTILTGTGKHFRHLNIAAFNDIDAPEIKRLFLAASELPA